MFQRVQLKERNFAHALPNPHFCFVIETTQIMGTQSTQEVKPLISKKEAANYFGVSVSTINRLILSEELKPIKVGGSIRFNWDSIAAFELKGGQTNVV